MKSSAIIAVSTAFLVLAVACSSESTASPDIPFPSANESKMAAQQLSDAWWRATHNRDAAAMYALLARNITDRCTLEQLEQMLAMDDDAFTTPELDVKQVFVDPENPEEGLAFMLMELRNEPRPGRGAEIGSAIESLPFPIYREDGRWLMGLSLFVAGDACLFAGQTSYQEASPSQGSTVTSP